jgi:hypothetical protein
VRKWIQSAHGDVQSMVGPRRVCSLGLGPGLGLGSERRYAQEVGDAGDEPLGRSGRARQMYRMNE